MNNFDDLSLYGRGLIPRDFKSFPVGQVVGVERFRIKTIPRDEWKDRIAEKDQSKSWLWDLMTAAGFKVKHQRGFSWCHSFGCAGAAEAERIATGLPYLPLSPSSVAGPITGWNANRGMPILDPLRYATEHGFAEQSIVPELTDDRRVMTPSVIENAKRHRVRGLDVDANCWDEIVTCAFLNLPTVWGIYRDWGHCVFGGVKCRIDSRGRLKVQYVNSHSAEFTDGSGAPGGCGEVEEGGYRCPEECYAFLSGH